VQNKRSTELTGLNRLQTTTDWYGNPITDPDRSNPTRNRFESPLQTIMSFQHVIAREENDMMAATRPGTSTTYRRSSYQPPPSRRTSSYSAYNAQPPRQEYRGDPRDPRDRDPREYNNRADSTYRGEPYPIETNGESSSNSSYNYDSHPVAAQEYSPPSTPTRGGQQFTAQTPQASYYPIAATSNPPQQYGIPSPEPDADIYYPRAPVKPPVHSFQARPATPPSDVGEKSKKGKLSKLKRFSGFGKSKS